MRESRTLHRFHEQVTMSVSIKRQQLLARLRQAAANMHEPSFDPANIEPERLERICSELRATDPRKIMEYEMTHRCEE